MKVSFRTLAILAVGAAVLSGGARPRSALAVDGATQNPANGHWYKYVAVSPSITWAAAKAGAESLGGHLASITDSAEHQWIMQNLDIANKSTCWLGGTDAAAEGTWVWLDGDAWTFSNWNSGEPNNAGGEHSLEMYTSGTWNDETATKVDPGYIVEWAGNPIPPTPDDPPDAPSGLSGSVLVGNPIQLTWTDNSDDEEAFEVERRTDSTTFVRIAELGPGSTLCEDNATSPDTAYTYRVRAKNSAGASAYSNEDTVVSSAIAPAPKAPSLLTVMRTSPGSIELWWSDNSQDEVAFEVHRRTPTGAFLVVASLPPNSFAYTEYDLAPDTAIVYGVRSVNAFRTSPMIQVATATLPTLTVAAVRGDLKDSKKFGKDSLKLWATFDLIQEASDGVFDPVAEGFSLRVGSAEAPVTVSIPGGAEGWKVSPGKATWKGPKGMTPKYKIEFDLEGRTVRAGITGLELAVPPANPVRVSLGIGDDAGSESEVWETTKSGALRLR